MYLIWKPTDFFTDADTADTLTVSATLADGSPLPLWLSFDPATLVPPLVSGISVEESSP